MSAVPASGVGTPLTWLCTQVESLQRLVVALLTRVADLERDVAPMKTHILGGGCVQPAWRQTKDEDMSELKQSVAMLQAFAKRMEPHVPPPLVALQELKREPVSEARGAEGEPFLLRLEPAANQLELTGLLFTVAFGDEAEALMAISSGQPLDAKDAIGRTALHCAASRGSAAISRMLLDHSNFVHYINSTDRYLRTALHMAARAGHLEVCHMLLSHRLFTAADAADCDGQTALHHAAAAGHEEVCAFLVAQGAVAHGDCFQRTPLHHAARHGHALVAQVLLPQADVWATDCDQLSALHCAAFRGHKDFCEELVNHSSFREACDTQLDIQLLRHARDEVRPVLQKAMALLGRALPDLTDQEETTFGAETTVWSPCSSPTERPRGPVTSREIFSDPLVAIHQQLQAAKVSCVEYFKQLDHDQDGRLGPEELQSCLSSLGYAVSFKELQDLLTRLDMRDGKVDILALDRAVRLEGAEFEVKRRRELEGAMRRAAGLEPSLASPLAALVVALLRRLKGSQMKIFDLFRSFDSDGDGLWSPSELRTALRSSGQEVGLQDIQKLMETMDSDRSGFLDVKELARALHRADLATSPDSLEAEFTDALSEIAARGVLLAIQERLEVLKLRAEDFVAGMRCEGGESFTMEELQRGLLQIGCEMQPRELDALQAVLSEGGGLSVEGLLRRMAFAASEARSAAERRLQDSPADGLVDILQRVNAALRAGRLTVYGRKIQDAHGFFKAIDKDGSGSLDPKELQRGFKRLGVDLSDQLLQQLTDAMDSNENGKIELDEFVRALHSPSGVQKRSSLIENAAVPMARSRSTSRSRRPSETREPSSQPRASSARTSPFRPGSRRPSGEEKASSQAEVRSRTSQRSSSPRIVEGRGSMTNSPRPRTSFKPEQEGAAPGGQRALDATGALRLIYQHMEKKRMRTIDLFRRLDQSDDGSITRSELRRGLEEIGLEIDAAAFKSLVGHLDRDSGGTINLKELDRGIKEAVREKYGKDARIDPDRFVEYELLLEIHRALFSGTQMIFGNRVTDSRSFFRAIDRDHSGELDAAELTRGLLKLGITVESEELVKELVDCIDRNASGLIDKEEFVKALQNPEELLAKPEEKKEKKVIEPGSEADATKALASIHQQLSEAKTRTTDWFHKMDTSRDGKISHAELKKGLKDMGCNLSASDLKAVLIYLDQDESGSLSLQELQKGMNRAVRAVADAALVVLTPASSPQEALAQVNAALGSKTQLIFGQRVSDGRSFFQAMDKDGNGTLDQAEVARGLRRLGVEVSDALLEELVKVIDVNQDGLIELKEFLEALKMPEKLSEKASDASEGQVEAVEAPESPDDVLLTAQVAPAAVRPSVRASRQLTPPTPKARASRAPVPARRPTQTQRATITRGSPSPRASRATRTVR